MSASTPHRAWLSADLRTRVERARAKSTATLLAERNSDGHWPGELSASALSTATAITALTLVGRRDAAVAQATAGAIRAGYAWLLAHQNADGGWGATTRSVSHISTTTLVWAALGVQPAPSPGAAAAVAAAERWLTTAAGSLAPDALVRAIEQRYGKDRTF